MELGIDRLLDGQVRVDQEFLARRRLVKTLGTIIVDDEEEIAMDSHVSHLELPSVSSSHAIMATPPATPSKLFLNERVEHCGPLAFEVSVLLETLLKQSFDSLQRLRPG